MVIFRGGRCWEQQAGDRDTEVPELFLLGLGHLRLDRAGDAPEVIVRLRSGVLERRQLFREGSYSFLAQRCGVPILRLGTSTPRNQEIQVSQ